MTFLNTGREIEPIMPGREITLPQSVTASSRVAMMEQNRKIASIFDDPLAIVPATIASMADTFGRSLGLLDDDDVRNFLAENFPDLGSFIDERRETLQAIGDIAGVFIPGALGVKAIRSTGFIGKLATRTLGEKGARYFTSTGLSNQRLFEESFRRAQVLAEKGARRVDSDPILRQLNKRLLGRSVGDVVIENLAADAAIVASMNESDFLFPDEISLVENLIYFGAFNAVFGLAAFAAARHTLRRGLNKATASLADSAQNPSALPRSQIQTNVVDNRGPALSVLAALVQDTEEQLRRGLAAGDQTLQSNADQALTAIQAQMAKVFEQLFRDSPIEGVTRVTPINPRNSQHLNTLRAVAENNAFAYDGVRSLEPHVPDLTANMSTKLVTKATALNADIATLQQDVKRLEGRGGKRAQRTLAKKRNKLQAKQDELNDLRRTLLVIYELDGSMASASQRADIFQDGARDIKHFRGFLSEATPEKLRLRVDDEGRIDFPKDDIEDIADLENIKREFLNSENFTKLTHTQKTAAHDLMQDMFERIEKAGIDKWDGMVLRSNSHHTQFDLAHRLVERFGPLALSKINGIDTLDEIIYGALNSKFRDYQILRAEATESMKRGRSHIYDHMDNVARALNLPTDNHILLEIFEAARVEGRDLPLQAIGADMDGIRNAIRVHAGGDASEPLAAGIRYRGTMHELSRDRQPVMGLLRNSDSTGAITRSELLQQTLAVRNMVIDRLSDPDSGSVITTAVMNDIMVRPELLRAAKEALPNVVQAADYGTIGKQFVTQAFRLRDVDAARPLDVIADNSQKATEKAVEAILQSPSNMRTADGAERLTHQQVFNRILDRNARGDMLNFFVARNALGNGWDVKDAIRTRGRDGKSIFQFTLHDKSPRNQALWRELFNEKMPERALLPTGPNSRVPVTMTELSFRTVESMNALSQQALREYNTLLRAQGKRQIKPKPWHLPAKDLSAEHKTYLLDRAGQVRVVVGGATARQSRENAKKEIENSAVPLFSIDETNMEMYFEARGRAFRDMDDFSKPTNQTGPAKGKSFGATVESSPAEFQRMLESLLRSYSDVGRSTRMLIFEPEIQFLKLQKASAGIGPKEPDNLYDLLVNRLVGTQNIHAEAVPGKLLLGFEGAYDKLMQRFFDGISGFRPRFGASEQFRQFSEALEPQHNPFADFNDFLQKTQNVPLPPELRRHAGVLNEFTTAMSIRVFDIGMGVINMMSLVSTLPPVLRMLQRLPAENEAEHLNRIAAWGAATPQGLAYFSPTRATMSGVHFMFSPEGRAVAKRASEKGYFDQFAAEQVELYGRTGEKFIPSILRSLSTKASIVTDKTERYARAVSWMTFYNVGKKGLGLHDDAAMAFAHAQANNVIADFRPSNRPVVFQGAAGMPFGLFTTFMWNFLQRIYSIVETRNMPALINQFGLHAAFFGAEAVPGVDLALQQLGTVYGDGSENLVDRAHRAFGPAGTEFVLNGSIATMLGVSLGPRAAIGLPGQMGFGLERQAAGLRMGVKLWDTFWNEVDVIKENEGIDATQMAEVLARSNINKGISNMIELMQGRSLDSRGNIIEEFEPVIGGDPIAAVREDARTRIAYGARAMGFKPLLADELRQENRRNRVTDRIQSELKERLSESLRSKIRGGRLRSEDVERALDNYVRAGGNPENFKRFFTSQVVRGTQNKLDREIAEALNTSMDRNRIARLLFLSSQE